MLHYDQSSEVYDNQYGEEQEAKINAALSSFSLEKDNVLLDMGCGTGILFSQIAKKVKLVVGIDISIPILTKAKKRKNGTKNISLIRADADHAPFLNETFDTVFAVTLIQNIPTKSRAISEIKRVARQKATIVITGLKKTFSQREFTSLLRDAGLETMALNLDERLKDYIAICVKTQRKP